MGAAKELPLEQALTQAATTRPGSRRAVSEILNVEIWSGFGNRLHLLLPTAKKSQTKKAAAIFIYLASIPIFLMKIGIEDDAIARFPSRKMLDRIVHFT